MPSLTPSIVTTLMSLPGTLPAALIASMAPRPMSSLCAYTTSMSGYAWRKPSMTVLPSARVKSPVSEAITEMLSLPAMASSNPVLRSMAGAEPVVPCSSTTLMGSVPRLSETESTDALALLDEVGPDERHVERRVLGVDRAVGQDDRDAGVLGLRARCPSRTRRPARTRCTARPGRCRTGSPGSGSPASAGRPKKPRSNPASAVRASWIDFVLADASRSPSRPG